MEKSQSLPVLKCYKDYGGASELKPKCEFSTQNGSVTSSLHAKAPSIRLSTFCGIILACLSGAMYGFTAALVKIENTIYSGEITLIRFVFITLYSLPMAIASRERFFLEKGTFPLVLFCCVTCAGSISFRYEAYHQLQIAEANLIVFGSPLLVSLLGICFLKEKVSTTLWISLISSTIGIVLVTRIPTLVASSDGFNHDRIIGLISAFLSLVLMVLFSLSLGKLKQYHYTVLTFHIGWIGILQTGIVLYFSGRATLLDTTKYEQFLTMFLSFLSFLAMISQTTAMKFESAGLVTLCQATVDILVTFLLQIIYFKESADLILIFGIIFILFSGIILFFGKWYSARKSKL